jgi:tetratricopeptide (TPR) repeat protein
MGFGKKTDYSTGNTYDLDKTYKNIIQPAVVESGYQCIRADEIQDSGIIDKCMYALLMHADLVIADITTFNPNAVYELGIRHAVKPFSTIILKEISGKIPFDLDHTRIFDYKHLGEDIGTDEARRCQEILREKITIASKNHAIDSPLYDYIKDIAPPQIPKKEFERIVGDLADREVHVFAIVEKAKELMNKSNFVGAIRYWEKASQIVPTEEYFIQQLALATYKSKVPTEQSALHDALKIIDSINPDETKDPETLGLTGAIYKRLWNITNDVEFLRRATYYYKKGFQVKNDYYTGENYALCLNLLGTNEENSDEKIYYGIAAKKVRTEIIESLRHIEENVEEDIVNQENKWAYATLATCYYGINENEKMSKFECIFLNLTESEWEKQTYKENKELLCQLLKES